MTDPSNGIGLISWIDLTVENANVTREFYVQVAGIVSKADFSRRPVSPRPVFFKSRRDSTTVLR